MKKLLALVLALVMSMSLVTISNAADFTDADKIDNLEAVEVMKAVGVLAGYTDGSFGPTDTLTRAQACKIVAYLDLTGDVADALTGTGKVFTDVAANNWAAGYIEYCAQAGYVSGIGDGKFDPNAKVTGLQFAKMLLAVLGYDAEIEGLVGSAWEINAAKLAAGSKLFENISNKNAALTRQEAAQAAFNALQAKKVEYKSDREGNYGKATKTATTLMTSLYENDLKKVESATNDEYGRPTSKWTYKGKTVCNAASSAALTYKGEVKTGTIYKDLDLDKKVAGVAVYSINVDATAIEVKANVDIENKGAGVIGGLGKVTEVFTDDDNNITKIVVIPYFVEKLDSDDVKDAVLYSDGTVKTKAYINLPVNGVDKKYETASFKADEYVVYTVGTESGAAKIMSVEAAEAVSGKVTASKGSKLTISGVTYDAVANLAEVGDEGTFYLSVDGSLAKFDEKSTSTGNFAYIYSITAKEGTNEDGQNTTTYTAYYVAADGTKASAKLYVDDNGKILNNVDPTVSNGYVTNSNVLGMYEYELTDDGMKAVENNDINNNASDNLKDVKIGDKYADSKTVFVFVYNKGAAAQAALSMTSGAAKVETKVVTGIANVEKFSSDVTISIVDKDDMVTYAFVPYAPADAESDATYAVMLDKDAVVTKSDDGKTTYYTHDVMVDGKKTTLTSKSSDKLASVANGAIFEYKLDTDKYVSSAITTIAKSITQQKVLKVVDKSLVFETAGAYTLADDAIVVILTGDTTDFTADTGAAVKADKVVAVYNDKDKLTLVVIDKRD